MAKSVDRVDRQPTKGICRAAGRPADRLGPGKVAGVGRWLTGGGLVVTFGTMAEDGWLLVVTGRSGENGETFEVRPSRRPRLSVDLHIFPPDEKLRGLRPPSAGGNDRNKLWRSLLFSV